MNEAWRLKVWTRFLASPAEVWKLKTDPRSLADEFRPCLRLSMSIGDQESLSNVFSGANKTAKLTTRIWPAGLTWPMEVEVVECGKIYRDKSRNALFSEWEHEHRLVPASDATLYIDDVRFVPPHYASKVVASVMRRLFEHRHKRAATHLAAEAGAVGVSVLRLDCPVGVR